MQTFVIKDGDLVLGPGGFSMIDGPQKVQQDLGVSMREPFGCDRFHPRWGTVLTDFIGQPVHEGTKALVQSEVNRIIQNYVASQNLVMSQDAAAGRKSRFSSGEIINSIDAVDVQQQFDRFFVRITLTTVAGDRITLGRMVTP